MAHIRLLISCQTVAIKRSGEEASLDAGQRRRWEEVVSRMFPSSSLFRPKSSWVQTVSLLTRNGRGKKVRKPKKESFHVWPHLVSVVSLVVCFSSVLPEAPNQNIHWILGVITTNCNCNALPNINRLNMLQLISLYHHIDQHLISVVLLNQRRLASQARPRASGPVWEKNCIFIRLGLL